MLVRHDSAIAAAILVSVSAVAAIPNWGGMNLRNAEVAGQTQIEALGPAHYGEHSTVSGAARYFLTPNSPDGEPGHAIVRPNGRAPRFFISPRDSQLYQIVNGTTIFHVSLHNITDASAVTPEQEESPLPLAFGTTQAPLRLSISPKKDGQTNGFWRWQGPMLFYETDTSVMKDGRIQGTNNGIFYQCVDKNGVPGIYTALTPIPTPPSCFVITLHSRTVSGADY